MGNWIAYIGSTVIGALLLLSLMRFNNDVSQEIYVDNLENITYGQLAQVVEIIKGDLSRVGLGVNDPYQPVVLTADSTDFRFLVDVDGDGIIDTMRYYLGATASAAWTENPHDRALYRVINGGIDEDISIGLVDFEIRYFDAAGTETAVPANIKTLEVSLIFESYIPYDNQYPRITWRGKITPPNLLAR